MVWELRAEPDAFQLSLDRGWGAEASAQVLPDRVCVPLAEGECLGGPREESKQEYRNVTWILFSTLWASIWGESQGSARSSNSFEIL